jgi:hypothetical protein
MRSLLRPYYVRMIALRHASNRGGFGAPRDDDWCWNARNLAARRSRCSVATFDVSIACLLRASHISSMSAPGAASPHRMTTSLQHAGNSAAASLHFMVYSLVASPRITPSASARLLTGGIKILMMVAHLIVTGAACLLLQLTAATAALVRTLADARALALRLHQYSTGCSLGGMPIIHQHIQSSAACLHISSGSAACLMPSEAW